MKASIFMVAALAGAGTPTLVESVIGTVLAHGGRLVAISPQLQGLRHAAVVHYSFAFLVLFLAQRKGIFRVAEGESP